MSQRYKGGVISATPPTTSTSSASGVWTEQQFMQGVASGSWPALAGAPTIGTATAGSVSASVAFTAPTYTGSGITGYTATSSPGGITGTGASSPITVSGLTAGTAYTFTVTATTAGGQGPASAASNSVTPTAATYIEEVFSTYLYTGNGSTQTITNGLSLSTSGGLTWIKQRNSATPFNILVDSARGSTYALYSNATSDQYSESGLTTLTSTGFSVGQVSTSVLNVNVANQPYTSWSFRKQPKFFDVVTWTGNGVNPRQISHSLGSVPGCIIIKSTTRAENWTVYHTSLGNTGRIALNTTDAAVTGTSIWANTTPTSTYFTVTGDNLVNFSGAGYVAYIFAHNAGGFGLTGSDNVISCGSYVGSGAAGKSVTLGYEPQWVLFKQTSDISPNVNQSWWLYDNMRGMPVGSDDAALSPNTSGAEQSYEAIEPTATGFNLMNGNYDTNASGVTYIYIAIRRGPMKVPTSGTSVFSPNQTSATTGTQITTGFPVDWQLVGINAGNVQNQRSSTRLTGVNTDGSSNSQYLITSNTNAEAATGSLTLNWGSTGFQVPSLNSGSPTIFWNFGRAPSFFDEVCYTGTGSATTVTHNLGVVPEMIIAKNRNSTYPWGTYHSALGTSQYVRINSTAASDAFALFPSVSSTTFGVSADPYNNGSGLTYVAYLFATCAGVSKVGSYTGTGATQTIDCGFSAGARWVLIKRTDSTGDWYVWDTARGMVSGTDPSLLLNSTAAEVNANSVYTTAVGFQIVSTASGINASGGTYIFLAIA